MQHKNYLDHVYAVSSDSGNLLELYRYTAFGQVETYTPTGQQLATSAIDNPVRWNSRRYDEATQLYYYMMRNYLPKLGRFGSRDPIGEQGGVNLYLFVQNDAINEWDKYGMLTNCLNIPRSAQAVKDWQLKRVTLTPGQIGNNAGKIENIEAAWEIQVIVYCCCLEGINPVTGTKVYTDSGLPDEVIFIFTNNPLPGWSAITSLGDLIAGVVADGITAQVDFAGNGALTAAEWINGNNLPELDWRSLRNVPWKNGDPCKELNE